MPNTQQYICCPFCEKVWAENRPGVEVFRLRTGQGHSGMHHYQNRPCTCGKWWYHVTIRAVATRQDNRRSRERMLTHVRSPEGKRRHNRLRNLRKRSSSARYRFRGVDILENVLVLKEIPLGRYAYHRSRYEAKGIPWQTPKNLKWSLGQRRGPLPDIVRRAVLKIYSQDTTLVVRPKKEVVPKRERAPVRPRSNSMAIDRLRDAMSAVDDAIQFSLHSDPRARKAHQRRWDALNERLQQEIELRMRRDYDELPGKPWDYTFDVYRYNKYNEMISQETATSEWDSLIKGKGKKKSSGKS